MLIIRRKGMFTSNDCAVTVTLMGSIFGLFDWDCDGQNE